MGWITSLYSCLPFLRVHIPRSKGGREGVHDDSKIRVYLGDSEEHAVANVIIFIAMCSMYNRTYTHDTDKGPNPEARKARFYQNYIRPFLAPYSLFRSAMTACSDRGHIDE